MQPVRAAHNGSSYHWLVVRPEPAVDLAVGK
jgi:hypothetical protein